MSDQLVEFLTNITYLATSIALVINLLKLGKAVGRIEQLLEVHTKDIADLKETKVDKETCEAYRSND